MNYIFQSVLLSEMSSIELGSLNGKQQLCSEYRSLPHSLLCVEPGLHSGESC
jgi:hypothetical protein